MKKKKFKPAPNSILNQKQVDKYGPEIQRLIKKKGGNLEPEEVVEFARDPKSPLHDWFTWDRNKASHLWLNHQARQLVASIIVSRIYKGEEVEHRVAWNISSGNGPRYESMDKVLVHPGYHQELVGDVLNQLRAWIRRNHHIEELVPICDGLEEALAEIEEDAKLAA